MIRLALADYDGAWPARFEEHRERIARALGARAVRIEHIGSTSVPGMVAKPVIDMLLYGVEADDEAARTALESAGYHVTVDEPGHRMYEPPDLDAHLHVWSDRSEADRHVLFRDWLRAHPQDRALYEHVKRQLAAREWPTSNDYAQAKSAVVGTIMRRARGEAPGPRIQRFAAALQRVLPQHARILEIGAGEGLLAARLAAAGYEVVALDTQLRSLYPIVETSFEAYTAPQAGFDCVAAQLFLHHAPDLRCVLDKIAMHLKPGGIVAIDDYGWERSDDPDFRNTRSDLHTSASMLASLRTRFEEIFYADHPYLADGAGADALAFTFIGRLR
ncbi:MAG TPA: GrpB family protein [Candidatus Baltobacteraceae bacterium]